MDGNITPRTTDPHRRLGTVRTDEFSSCSDQLGRAEWRDFLNRHGDDLARWQLSPGTTITITITNITTITTTITAASQRQG